ncbi:MAG: hypothetical protein ACI30W_08480 [Muribaculaceae bacterium]
MKVKLLIMVCAMLVGICAVRASASGDYRSVVVTTAAGEELRFDLGEAGVTVSFTDSEMVIGSASRSVELPLTAYARFEFSSEGAGISGVNRGAAAFVVEGSRLVISGLQPGSVVEMAAIDGRLRCGAIIDTSGNYTSPELQRGIYVVSTEIATFKFIIR